MNRKVIAKQKAAVDSSQALTMEAFLPQEHRDSNAANGNGNGTRLGEEISQRKSVLIASGTGTGKTTQMILSLVGLLEKGTKPEEMGFITWSREASAEIRERLTAVLEGKKELKVRASDIEIRTLRSYTSGLLHEQAGETIKEVSDSQAGVMILEGLRQNNTQRYPDEYLRDLARGMQNAIGYLKGFGLTPEKINTEKVKETIGEFCEEKGFDAMRTSKNLQYFDMFMKAFEHYETAKSEKGMLDQNDTLMLLKERLDRGEGPYSKYKYVFVDGIQDMNVLESYVVAKSGETKILVRDDKKAIFGFRGGGIENAWSFADVEDVMVGGAGNVNKRNLPELSNYTKEFFLGNVSDRKDYEADFEGMLNARKDRKGVVQLVPVSGSMMDQVEAAAAVVKQLHDRGEKVGVLSKTNAQLKAMEEKLDVLGIRYISKRHGGGFDAKSDVLDFMRGLLYNEPAIVTKALFTPYAQVSWADASDAVEKYNTGKMTWPELEQSMPSFFGIKKAFTRSKMAEVFEQVIIPISVEQGDEHHRAALSIYRSMKDYVEQRGEPNRTELFDHLEMSAERSEPVGKGNGVTLSTVWGATNKWFDNVVYMPLTFRNRLEYVDVTKQAIMKTATGIDIIEKTRDEQIKVDFVAMTRAKNELYIVSDQKEEQKFNVKGFIEIAKPAVAETVAETKAPEVLKKEARGLKSTNAKVRDAFIDHFARNSSVSFSQVDKASTPLQYVFAYIYKTQEQTPSMKVGAEVHEIAERFFRKTLDEGKLNDTEKRFLDNIKDVYAKVTEAFGVRQTDAEYVLELDINEVFSKFSPGTRFKGKVDAVFERKTDTGTKYILLDYKTDKDETWFGDHEKQVALYRKAFAIKRNVREEDIDVVVAFIGKSDATGSFGVKLHSSAPAKDIATITKKKLDERLAAIEEDTAKFLEYKKDPDKFIQAVLSAEPRTARERRLRDALLAEGDPALKTAARLE